MSKWFDGCSDTLRRVFALSRSEALRRSHGCIDSGHLMLAVLERECLARTSLLELGVDTTQLSQTLDTSLPPGDAPPTSGFVPFSSATKATLKLAVQESNALAHEILSTGHLLEGIMRSSHPAVREVSLSLDACRSKTEQLFAAARTAQRSLVEKVLQRCPSSEERRLVHLLAKGLGIAREEGNLEDQLLGIIDGEPESTTKLTLLLGRMEAIPSLRRNSE